MSFPDDSRTHQLTILGAQIADIEVLPTSSQDVQDGAPSSKSDKQIVLPHPGKQFRQPLLPLVASGAKNEAAPVKLKPTPTPKQDAPTSSNGFVDPAILSYTKVGQDDHTFKEEEKPALSTKPVVEPQESRARVSATLTQPFNALTLQHTKTKVNPQKVPLVTSQKVETQEVDGLEVNGQRQVKTKTRKNRKTRPKLPNSTPDLNGTNIVQAVQTSDGWRQTPILQPAGGEPDERRRSNVSRGKGKKHGKTLGPRPNGWATEDATDVQEMGDFDFAENLSKFDKAKVFEEIRNGDTTADEDLLVSHNRVRRPGTFDGSKIHPSENILTRRQSSKEVSFESDGDSGHNRSVVGSNKIPRSSSRASVRQPIRQNSARAGAITYANLTNLSLLNKTGTPLSVTSPHFRDSDRRLSLSQVGSRRGRPRFQYSDNARTCPTVTLDTLREIEEVAIENHGLNSDILADRAGRGIAQCVLSTINPGGRRLTQENHNSSPVVVILLGDSEAGASALAAGSFLRERDVRVIASAVDGAATQDSEALQTQVRRFQGDITSWEATSKSLKTLDAPPELIIDSLVGLYNSSALLQDSETRSEKDAKDMMAWANLSKASVLAVDLPSGVDSASGEVRIREGEPVEIRAKIVVCSGAPCVGLLRAMSLRSSEGHFDEWRIQVCDVGINRAMKAVTKAANPRNRAWSVDFGTGWAVSIGLDAGSA